MKFIIAGVHRYAVRIPDKALYDEHGDELDGLAIESRRLILISPAVQPERREEVLGHELEHCWAWHVPPATTNEQRCQLTATIAQSFREDLDRQGGIDALRAMKAEPISLPYSPPATRQSSGPANNMGLTDRCTCGGCEAETMCGSVEHGQVIFHEGLKQYQLPRWFRCEACGAMNIWHEVATSDGRPTGLLVSVPAPKVLRGKAAGEWMKENAAAHQPL